MTQDTQSPLVSIIIPYFNCHDYIEETLQSIEQQTYRNYEVILVNDGSKPESTAFLESFLLKKPDVRYIYQANKGAAAARNNGGMHAAGEFILFLDADDLLHKDHLKKTVDILQSKSDCKLVYTKAEFFEAQKGEWKLPSYQGMQSLLQGNMIYITALHRRSDFLGIDGFDENLDTYEDWDYWIRLLKDNQNVHWINETLFFYRKRNSDNSLTNELDKDTFKSRYDFQKVYLKNNDTFLKYNLGYLDFCQIISKFRQNQSQNANPNIIANLNKQHKQNNLLVLKLLKPFIKFEQGLHSINRYRKAFNALVKGEQSIISAYIVIKRVYDKYGLSKAKKYLRAQHHVFNFYAEDYSEFSIESIKETFELSEGVVILTKQHTYFVALLIQNCLKKANIKCEIIFNKPRLSFKNKWHIVICPNAFDQLPLNFIAFQMEQSVSSRWFTEEYFNALDKAKFVFDYSIKNIEYLKTKLIQHNKIYYTPIGTLKNFANPKTYEPDEFCYDVAFYGDPNCERRQRFLTELNKHFSVLVICNVFGDDLYQSLKESKVVVNIHYYENALLETTRLYECLSLNKIIVSEIGCDQQYHQELNDVIDFVEIDDINHMIEKIKLLLNDANYYNDRVDKINLFNDQESKFDKYFYQFLLSENVITKEKFDELLIK